MSRSVAEQLLPLFGVDSSKTKQLDFGNEWNCKSILRSDTTKPPVPVILIESGPKNIAEVRNKIKDDGCIVILESGKSSLLLRALNESHTIVIDGDGELDRVISILKRHDISGAKSGLIFEAKLLKIIAALPVATEYFDNRGIFSNHYLRNRIWDDIRFAQRDIGQEVESVKAALGNTEDMLAALGWKSDTKDKMHKKLDVAVVVTNQSDLGIRIGDDVAPSYRAVAALKNRTWAILTNGRIWRLYTNKISASTTNYFEINVNSKDDAVLQYLAVIFGVASYEGKNPQISTFFKQAREKSKELEADLQLKILRPDGLFLEIVKGVLDHDGKKKYSVEDLDSAKEVALTVLYRVWFILYAESRNLLPVIDQRYAPISLRTLWRELGKYEADPNGNGCWTHLLGLFDKIRNGSPQHNLPQYDGGLFKSKSNLDGIIVRNRFSATALRELFETDGEPVDYGSLGVRHLGNIYEALLEFRVRQADRNIALLEDKKGVREVESWTEATYSYKKYDLYLISSSGIISRKTTASFYTPDKIVEFLVRRGLEPILIERESMMAGDVSKYLKDPTPENHSVCLDRLLDIQVLDPAMGSGHFLVEALNQITGWATGMLDAHPGHPLLEMIENDRMAILNEQKGRGVDIDENLLTHDVLLKRRIMKRCIFGVDLNPRAVELARLSLWLDSFAIGVPLTYLDHHIRRGDSTIGARLDDLAGMKNQSLDTWMDDPEKFASLLQRVSDSPDITIGQVRRSREKYEQYSEQTRIHRNTLDGFVASLIDGSILPKRSPETYLARLAGNIKDRDLRDARKQIVRLADLHQFFHWELEMMDAFTDARRGFDLVVGNPPWEIVSPNNDEFFTQYEPMFRSLKPKPIKDRTKEKLLKNSDIRLAYAKYVSKISEELNFYKSYKKQGTGSRDLWKLVMERVLGLVCKGGTVSMVIPSQLLSGNGNTDLRREIINKDILQIYVFENRKKIFPIHSSYRFILLTMRNIQATNDEFPAAFWLHDLESLKGKSEKEKFVAVSRKDILTMYPKTAVIPEVNDGRAGVLKSLFDNPRFGLDEEWDVELSSGFQTSQDADLFETSKRGWDVLKGKNIHQFNHHFSESDFVCSKGAGLERLGRKRVYMSKCRELHDTFRVAFRAISSPTNMRSILAAVIPPRTFHAHSVLSIVLSRSGRVELGDAAMARTSYLCGVLNSMSFDFAARSILQMNVSTIILKLPIPKPSEHDGIITECTAKLCVGTREFEPLAESLHVENETLTPGERIETTARLDALVAHAYGLPREQYRIILDSFKFNEDPSLLKTDTADWSDNDVLKCFYGEVRKAAMKYYDENRGP